MEQYINKSALVAEIERRKKTWSHQDQQYVNGGKDVCDYLLGFLDTLEAIEIGVDFGDPKGDIGTKTVFNDSKVLEISRHGNSRIWQNGDLEDFINELSKQFPDVSFAKLSRIAIRAAKWGRNRAKVEIQAESMAFAHGCPKEPVSGDLKKAADNYVGHAPEIDEDLSCFAKRNAFISGVQWKKGNLWKNAQGDDLPEIDREVIVLYQPYQLEGSGECAVGFAHRPPERWYGRNLDGEEHVFEPKTYDKGEWNIPNVVWWLDLDLPKEEK